jgi:hypothetical protein
MTRLTNNQDHDKLSEGDENKVEEEDDVIIQTTVMRG